MPIEEIIEDRPEEEKIRKIYEKEEALKLLVWLLQHHKLAFTEYDYGKFLDKKMETNPRKALKELQPILDNLSELDKKSNNNPQLYFFDEAGYIHFLDELCLSKALKGYFELIRDEKPMPEITHIILRDKKILGGISNLSDFCQDFAKWKNGN